jgi:hypothetical protein
MSTQDENRVVHRLFAVGALAVGVLILGACGDASPPKMGIRRSGAIRSRRHREPTASS